MSTITNCTNDNQVCEGLVCAQDMCICPIFFSNKYPFCTNRWNFDGFSYVGWTIYIFLFFIFFVHLFIVGYYFISILRLNRNKDVAINLYTYGFLACSCICRMIFCIYTPLLDGTFFVPVWIFTFSIPIGLNLLACWITLIHWYEVMRQVKVLQSELQYKRIKYMFFAFAIFTFVNMIITCIITFFFPNVGIFSYLFVCAIIVLIVSFFALFTTIKLRKLRQDCIVLNIFDNEILSNLYKMQQLFFALFCLGTLAVLTIIIIFEVISTLYGPLLGILFILLEENGVIAVLCLISKKRNAGQIQLN